MTQKKQPEVIDFKLLNTLYRKSGDGVLIASPKTKKFIFANPKICKMLGYTKKEVLKLGVLDIHRKKDTKIVLREFSDILKLNKKLIKALPTVKKNKEIIYCDISTTKTKIGDEEIMIGFFRDVSKEIDIRTSLEERIKELRGLYGVSRLLESSVDIDKKFLKILKVISESYQHPDLYVKIKYNNREYKLKKYKKTKWLQSSDVVFKRVKVGYIEVCYPTERDFLPEEAVFLNEIANQVGIILGEKIISKELKDSEKRNREIIEEMPGSFTLFDLQGKILTINKPGAKNLGGKVSDFIGKSVYDILPKDAPFLRKRHKKIVRGRKIVEFEDKLVMPTGKIFWFLTIFKPVKGDKGKIYAIQTISFDITEKKKMEQDLKGSEEEYRTTFENLLVGVVVHASDTSIIFSNPEATRILGLTTDQMQGKKAIDPSWSFVNKDLSVLKAEDYPVSKAISSKKPFKLQTLGINRPDRDYITWVAVSAITKFTKGKLDKVILNFVDITEKKKVEENLQESEGLYRNLVERAGDGILLLQKDIFIFANAKFAKLLGYSVEEVTGIHFSKVIYPSELKMVSERYHSRLQGKKVPKIYDTALMGKHGERVDVELSAGIFKHKGEDTDLVFVRDIRERKINEKRLRAREQELVEKNKALTELDKLKDDFLNVATHELKTPLIPIKTQIELLLAGDYGDLKEKQKEALEMVFRNEEKLNNLVSDVLDVAKIKSKKIVIIPQKIDLKKLISNSIKDAEVMVRDKKIKITFNTLSKLPTLKIDKKRMEQVVGNLFGNAIKFSPPKGEIKCEVKKVKNNIIVNIEDDGIGMTKQSLVKLFTPFFQADASASRKYGGTGLGLSICRGIIEAHGGKIEAKSPGLKKGSTFSFSLPINK